MSVLFDASTIAAMLASLTELTWRAVGATIGDAGRAAGCGGVTFEGVGLAGAGFDGARVTGVGAASGRGAGTSFGSAFFGAFGSMGFSRPHPAASAAAARSESMARRRSIAFSSMKC